MADFLATLAFAPRIERGVLLGVGLAVAVHLWRELRLHVDANLTADGTLHLRPQDVSSTTHPRPRCRTSSSRQSPATRPPAE